MSDSHVDLDRQGQAGLAGRNHLSGLQSEDDAADSRRVVHVNADATTDPQGRLPPYYRGEVVVTPDGMKKLKMHEIKAGMPARGVDQDR
jgi:hypothetical protein